MMMIMKKDQLLWTRKWSTFRHVNFVSFLFTIIRSLSLFILKVLFDLNKREIYLDFHLIILLLDIVHIEH